MKSSSLRLPLAATLALMLACGSAAAQVADPAVQRAAAAQKQPLLDTLKELVSIETGSRDVEGLRQASELIAAKLRALGGQVEIIEPTDATTYRMSDTPAKPGRMVRATFKGTGSKRILLLAHMDTVYLKGMLAKQPFRIDGDRAYGLGIADEKQGIALALHTVALLQALHFNEYGTLTVLVNGDEEISSPGSRAFIADAGAQHDAVLSSRLRASRTRSCRWPPAASAPCRSRSKAAPRMRRRCARARRQRVVRAVEPGAADA